MLNKEEVILLHHYLEEGLSKTAVANKLGISRRTVHRYVKSGKREPRYSPRPPRHSKLEPYKKYLAGRLEMYPELSAVRLLDEIRSLGYEGGYTVLKDYLRSLRPKLPIPMEQRFEVEPGEQAQVDFATFKTPFGTVYALLVVLSWSRTLWVRFVMHQDQLTVVGGLHHAFVSFGGVPRTLLFDRMKTAVSGAGAGGAAVFNAEMLRFASHYGFRPKACRPYRAKTKGRVERMVSYLRGNFFYGRSFRDLDDLNAQCTAWLSDTANARVHATTGEVPTERLQRERHSLLPLPVQTYIPMVTIGRRISKDGYISYNGNEYSVPEGVVSHELQVRATLSELLLLQDGQMLARHRLVEGRGQRILARGHRKATHSSSPVQVEHPVLVGEESVVLTSLPELAAVQRRSLDVYERVLQ